MFDSQPIAVGCMRLSTEPDRDAERSVAVLHAALDAGVTLLDTADAYCWDDSERGHNERLIARALSSWTGDRSRITIATKGGMRRPEGRWQTDGRAKHLAAACEQSCRALGVDRIALYQLHAPDSRTPLATSVRALASLKRSGLVAAIGLCNVTVQQLDEARRIVDIDCVQVEASVWHDAAFLSGVADYCLANRMRLLAHRPLGGRKSRSRTAADPSLNAVARRHQATPFEIALAWLRDLSALIIPLPGVTRIETAQSAARAQRIELDDDDRRVLDERFAAGRSWRKASAPPASTTRAPRRDADVVLLVGLPGAGKTTYAQRLVGEGYHRLNRDETGGTLRDLIPDLEHAIDSGTPRIVLDNTYLSRRSRAEVIRAAAEQGAGVRCVFLDTPIEDAQINVVDRFIDRYGRLPDEIDKPEGLSPQPFFMPTAQFRAQRELEPPDSSEGFSRVDIVRFERRINPSYTNRAVIVWCDDVLMRSRSGRRSPSDPDDLELFDARAATLRRYAAEGWRVLGLSWQPEIEAGGRTRTDVDAVVARVNELIAIEIEYCPHAAGPPRCWCRKPLPGLGIVFIHRHQLDPARCLYVGEGAQDPGFARKLGFTFRHTSDFFDS